MSDNKDVLENNETTPESATAKEESLMYGNNETNTDPDTSTEEITSESEPTSNSEEKVTETEAETKEEGDKESKGEDNEEGEVSYELKLSENSYLEEASIEQAVEFAKEHNLDPKVAQELLNRQEEMLSQFVQNEISIRDKELQEWRNQVVNDPDLGGEKLQTTSENARRVVEKYGTPEFIEILKDTGYGDNPEVVRFLSKIGSLMSDDSLIVGPPPSQVKSPEEIMYGN